MDRQVVISAAEVGEYVFCRRAWWLRRVHGAAPENVTVLRSGVRLHARHSARVLAAIWLRYCAYLFVLIAILLGGLSLLP